MPIDAPASRLIFDMSEHYPVHPDVVGRVVPSQDPEHADSVEQGFIVADPETGALRFRPAE